MDIEQERCFREADNRRRETERRLRLESAHTQPDYRADIEDPDVEMNYGAGMDDIVERLVGNLLRDPEFVRANWIRGGINADHIIADERRRCGELVVEFMEAEVSPTVERFVRFVDERIASVPPPPPDRMETRSGW